MAPVVSPSSSGGMPRSYTSFSPLAEGRRDNPTPQLGPVVSQSSSLQLAGSLAVPEATSGGERPSSALSSTKRPLPRPPSPLDTPIKSLDGVSDVLDRRKYLWASATRLANRSVGISEFASELESSTQNISPSSPTSPPFLGAPPRASTTHAPVVLPATRTTSREPQPPLSSVSSPRLSSPHDGQLIRNHTRSDASSMNARMSVVSYASASDTSSLAALRDLEDTEIVQARRYSRNLSKPVIIIERKLPSADEDGMAPTAQALSTQHQERAPSAVKSVSSRTSGDVGLSLGQEEQQAPVPRPRTSSINGVTVSQRKSSLSADGTSVSALQISPTLVCARLPVSPKRLWISTTTVAAERPAPVSSQQSLTSSSPAHGGSPSTPVDTVPLASPPISSSPPSASSSFQKSRKHRSSRSISSMLSRVFAPSSSPPASSTSSEPTSPVSPTFATSPGRHWPPSFALLPIKKPAPTAKEISRTVRSPSLTFRPEGFNPTSWEYQVAASVISAGQERLHDPRSRRGDEQPPLTSTLLHPPFSEEGGHEAPANGSTSPYLLELKLVGPDLGIAHLFDEDEGERARRQAILESYSFGTASRSIGSAAFKEEQEEAEIAEREEKHDRLPFYPMGSTAMYSPLSSPPEHLAEEARRGSRTAPSEGSDGSLTLDTPSPTILTFPSSIDRHKNSSFLLFSEGGLGSSAAHPFAHVSPTLRSAPRPLAQIFLDPSDEVNSASSNPSAFNQLAVAQAPVVVSTYDDGCSEGKEEEPSRPVSPSPTFGGAPSFPRAGAVVTTVDDETKVPSLPLPTSGLAFVNLPSPSTRRRPLRPPGAAPPRPMSLDEELGVSDQQIQGPGAAGGLGRSDSRGTFGAARSRASRLWNGAS